MRMVTACGLMDGGMYESKCVWRCVRYEVFVE